MAKLSRTRRVLAGAGLCVCVLSAAIVPADAIQVDFIDSEIDDGNFTGTIALNGIFAVDPSVLDSRVSGLLTVGIDVGGPATMVVSDGVVTGDWSLVGNGGVDGTFTSQDFTLSVQADTVYDATGTFGGTSAQAQLDGIFNSTTTAKILSSPALPVSVGPQTSSASDPVSEVFTDVMAGCHQFVARFDRRLSAEIEAEIPGATVNARGIVALYDDVTDDEQLEELEAIARGASAIDNTGGDPFIHLVDAMQLLRRAQQLLDEVSANSDCPPTKEFFTMLTNVARRLGSRALEGLESDTGRDFTGAALPMIVDLILGTGADGSGSTVDSMLLERAEAIGRDVWLEAMAADVVELTTIVPLSVLAVQMGWDFTTGAVDAATILLVVGDDS